MKEGWELKSLDDISLIKGRIGYRGYTKSDLVNDGEGAISLSPSNIKDNRLYFKNCTYISWEKYNESPEIMIYEGDIIFCKTASIGKVALVTHLPVKATLNPQFVVLKNIDCNNKYLYYFMTSEDFKKQIAKIIGGTSVPTLSQKNLGALKLPIPLLPEQQRIVSIIDEAFEAIDKAIENTQKNLQNAKELFESYLNNVFENEGHGWEEKKWCDVLKIISGRNQSDVEDQNGRYPILGSAGKVMGYASQYLCEANTTIIGRKGTINSPMFIEEPFWNVDTAFGLHSGPSLNSRFLYYFCCSYDFTKEDKGSGRPSLVKSDLLKLTIPLPSLTIQIEIVKKIDTLKIEIQQLQSKYQQKLRDLEELKKSVLNKAFAGEL